MSKIELLSQTDFAKLPEVNQSISRINLLMRLGKLKPRVIGGKRFIEKTEQNIEIAKKKVKKSN